MSQPNTACVVPHLLRIILFVFIKLFPSLHLSHPPRRGKPAAVRLCSFSLAAACRSIADKGYSLIFVIILFFCFYLERWYNVVSSSKRGNNSVQLSLEFGFNGNFTTLFFNFTCFLNLEIWFNVVSFSFFLFFFLFFWINLVNIYRWLPLTRLNNGQSFTSYDYRVVPIILFLGVANLGTLYDLFLSNISS